MNYWLFKTEPGCFSIDDLTFSPDSTTSWDGVRNYQARNLMKSMKVGDMGFFYHSGKNPCIVALVEVVREAYPDHTAQDPKNSHYDEKATPEDPRWFMVDVRLVRRVLVDRVWIYCCILTPLGSGAFCCHLVHSLVACSGY